MKEKSITINIFAKSLLNILNFILPILVAPYLARILDTSLYALYNEGISLLTWFILFASFGIYNYGLRCISSCKNNIEKSQKMFSILFYFGVITSSITLVAYFIYVFFFNFNNFLLYSIFSIQILANIFYIEWINEAVEDYVFILFKTSSIRIINVLSVFLFVKKPTDIIMYALITSLTILINNIASFIHIKKKIKLQKVTLNDISTQFKPLLNMFLMANASMLFTSLDKLMLSLFTTGIEITYYTFSQQIILIISNVLNSIVLAVIPRLSHYIGEGKIDDYNVLLSKTSNLFLLITIPVSIGISAISTNIMLIYGGNNYIQANEVLFLFGIRNVLSAVILIYSQLIIFVNGYESFLTKIYLYCGLVNLFLNLVLIKCNLIYAKYFILTTIIAEIVEFCLEAKFIKNNITKVILNKFKYKKYFLYCMMFYPICFIINRYINYDSISTSFILNTMISIISCSFYYLSILLITKDNSLQLIFNKLVNSLKVIMHK